MAQVLEHLPSKHKVLNSIPSTKNQPNKQQQKNMLIANNLKNLQV
jgi:hypothetical protein